MIPIFKKYPGWSLIVLAILMLGPGFAILDVSIMEARNFITAREMITENNWIMTTMNGEARYQKPPFPTWITALTMILAGSVNIIWLRLAGIVMVGLCGLMVYRISLVLNLDHRHSLINALVAITSFYVIAIVIEAPWDIYAHVFMGLCILFLVEIIQSKRKLIPAIFFSSLFLGASILSKGPVSLYALLLPFLFAYGFTYGFGKTGSSWGKIISIMLLGIVIGGWWYLTVRLKDPLSFEAIAAKETENWSSYNVRPFYYYWSFFTQSGIWTLPALMGLVYPYMIKRVKDKKAYRLSWIWTISAVVLLSLIPEKKSRYLMPVLIPMALTTGHYLWYVWNSDFKFKNKAEAIPMYVQLVILGLVGIGFPVAAYYIFNSSAEVHWWHVVPVSIIMLIIGILAIKVLFRKNGKEIVKFLIAFAIAAFFLIPPLASSIGDGNYKPLVNLRESIEKNEVSLFQSGALAPEFIWQYGDKIPVIDLRSSEYTDQRIYFLSQDAEGNDIPSDLYEIRNLDHFDLNRNTKGNGTYRERLKVYLFEVVPK